MIMILEMMIMIIVVSGKIKDNYGHDDSQIEAVQITRQLLPRRSWKSLNIGYPKREFVQNFCQFQER